MGEKAVPDTLNDILRKYQRALEHTQAQHRDSYAKLIANGEAFYNSHFRTLIRQFQPRLTDDNQLLDLQATLRRFIGKNELHFAAIDGASYATKFSDYLVYYGGSFGITGTVSVQGSPPKPHYKEWTPNMEDSYSSYLPIPLATLHRHEDSQFVHHSDEEKLDFARFDKCLMELAEIYLACEFLGRGNVDQPQLMLLDHSIASLLNSTTLPHDKIPMVGYKTGYGPLTEQDIVYAYSRPYNAALRIPFPKRPQFFHFVLSLLESRPRTRQEIADAAGWTVTEVDRQIPPTSLIFQKLGDAPPLVRLANGALEFDPTYRDSWRRVVTIFQTVCHTVFHEKAAAALEYDRVKKGQSEPGMLTTKDLQFLVAVGLRHLIELCWEHGVLLLGIQRQSSSRYLTRNYLGVLRQMEKMEMDPVLLPWSDSAFLQTLPYLDSLEAPWTTIEFDAAFMTLHCRSRQDDGTVDVVGVQGDIVQPPPRLILRSMAQFYIDRGKGLPYTGTILHIDRLAVPSLDVKAEAFVVADKAGELGEIQTLYYANADAQNHGQDLAILALKLITEERYPEFIGLPDPLHKAEWGARSIRSRIQPMIASSRMALRDSSVREIFRSRHKVT